MLSSHSLIFPSSFQDVWKELHAFINSAKVAQPDDAKPQGNAAVPDEPAPQTFPDDPPSKRIKLDSDSKADGGESEGVSAETADPTDDSTESSVCVVCLGVLQDFCNPDFTKKVLSFCDHWNEWRVLMLICHLGLIISFTIRNPGVFFFFFLIFMKRSSLCLDSYFCPPFY